MFELFDKSSDRTWDLHFDTMGASSVNKNTGNTHTNSISQTVEANDRETS